MTPPPALYQPPHTVPLVPSQDLDPNMLKLEQVFELFRAQYNRSYSNPKGIPGHVLAQFTPSPSPI